MSDQELDYLKPLCPTHYKIMVISPGLGKELALESSDAIDIHWCHCPVAGCVQNYSPSFGYFTLARRDDYWIAAGSNWPAYDAVAPSLLIKRSPKCRRIY